MYHKDYILRMIEMMAELIAGILGLIRKGETKQAENSIQQTYLDFLKEDASYFRKLKKDELTDCLLIDHNYTHGHLEILSELFYVEGELNVKKGSHELAMDFFEKALILLRFIQKESKDFSLRQQNRIEILEEKIKS